MIWLSLFLVVLGVACLVLRDSFDLEVLNGIYLGNLVFSLLGSILVGVGWWIK